MKDLISGKKKRIKGKEVRNVNIPAYDNLTISCIAAFVNPYKQVGHYLPENKEIPKLGKQWIGNVCATVLQDIFTDWVAEKVDERNESLVTKKVLVISMDPEIAKIFQLSTKTSGKLIKFFQ